MCGMHTSLAKFAIAATIAAPGFSRSIGDQDVAHWSRAGDGLGFLIQAAWTEGEAQERGIAVTDSEAREAVDEAPHNGLTRSDLVYASRVRLLEARIRDQIAQPAAQSVTPEQIDAYVQEHPRTEPERRRLRLFVASDRAEARAAQRALRRGRTWRSAARRYATEGDGAARTIEPGLLADRVEKAVFRAPRNALTRYGTAVFKVTAIIPGGPTPLAQQRATAWEVLSSAAQARAIDLFELDFRARWRLRTTCAPEYATHLDCSGSPNGRVTR